MSNFIPLGYLPLSAAVGRWAELAFGPTIGPSKPSDEDFREMERYEKLLKAAKVSAIVHKAKLAAMQPTDEGSVVSLPIKQDAVKRVEAWRGLNSSAMAKTRELISNALYSGILPSHILHAETGHLVPIPNNLWASDSAGGFFASGIGSVQVGLAPHFSEIKGRILIRADELEAVIAGKPATHPAPQPSGDAVYVPPYLGFMLQAVSALGLSDAVRMPKKQVEDWLEKNWPTGLGPISSEKKRYMATFLRHPDDEKGGHHKPDRITKG
ncbi:hypothetical protein [Magnetospirillum sp. ME-1]|uniref:hypothetical protein n=1 Tax=Magnetospirillum sp. ME-1 TaxID=1639348 RepID=UPI0011AE7BCD|nr:hypothetical protein [Magnetospirillum sp. ME-1]